ncbi:hypothetical protein [Robertkochia solimangrovi]|uniref:hypothetical protein n=1 Tax=Robertkochia solimangrovi TaxID=2213046 RepID=UPI00117E20FC|nr:hypothetical protein [Robertkochia solimangrovi]TRZ46163.1 hypothetical protein DMZ48_02580 [Robertkochia solimangrovi]
MIYFYLIIYLFRIINITEPQPEITITAAPDYIEYTRIINKAESSILNEKIGEAQHYYDEAFKLTKRPLTNHCYTSLQVSAMLKDPLHFKDLSGIAFRSGLKPEYLEKDSLLNSFIQEEHLYEYLEQTYLENKDAYAAQIDKFLYDTIGKIAIKDQKWKVYYLETMPKKHPEREKEYEQIYDSIVSHLVEEQLMPLIEQYGYPGERKLGSDPVGYVPNDAFRWAFVNNTAKLVLLHYYSRPKTERYNALLNKEVKKGNLVPEHYASIMDFQAQYGSHKTGEEKFYNQWMYSKDSTQFEAINRRRAEIGLPTFQEKEKKDERGHEKCAGLKQGQYHYIKLFHWCG